MAGRVGDPAQHGQGQHQVTAVGLGPVDAGARRLERRLVERLPVPVGGLVVALELPVVLRGPVAPDPVDAQVQVLREGLALVRPQREGHVDPVDPGVDRPVVGRGVDEQVRADRCRGRLGHGGHRRRHQEGTDRGLQPPPPPPAELCTLANHHRLLPPRLGAGGPKLHGAGGRSRPGLVCSPGSTGDRPFTGDRYIRARWRCRSSGRWQCGPGTARWRSAHRRPGPCSPCWPWPAMPWCPRARSSTGSGATNRPARPRRSSRTWC